MSQSLIQAISQFTDAHDEAQLRALEEAIGATRRETLDVPEFKAMLSIFERFPEDDGYGIFWSIVHLLEACGGYEPSLLESVVRSPGEFNLLMVNRLINGGAAEVAGESLLRVLASVANNPLAVASARSWAQQFIGYQEEKARTDA
jgi:hypothetical protein